MITVSTGGETVQIPDPVITTRVVALKPFTDPNTSGLNVPSGTLLGAGVGVTTYQIPANTAKVTAPTSGTNQLYLIRCAGINSTGTVTDPEIGGFTVQGTPQGALYNGLMVQYSNGAHVHDIAISDVPGDASSPPGETFSLNLWHANDALVERVSIDGGTVAATLFGINSCTGIQVSGYTGHNSIYGMGIAIWDSGDITLTDCDLSSCRHPINVEQAHPGTMRFTRPNLTKQRDTGPPMTVNSAIGSTLVYITDPIVDKWPLQCAVAPMGTMGNHGIRTQNPADIHLILNGVDVSSDPTKLITHY